MLDIGQQIFLLLQRIDKGGDLVGLQLPKLLQVVPPLLAHGGQQRIDRPLIALQQGARFHLGLHFCLQSGQGVAVENIPPVVLAGIGDKQMHVNALPQGVQRLHIARRQGRDAKHEDACRQWSRQLGARAKCGNKIGIEIGSVIARRRPRQNAIVQLAPQLRLPRLPFHPIKLGSEPTTGLPTGNPVGAIDQILVKQIGDLLTKLPQSHLLGRLAVGREIAGERCKGRTTE